MMRVIQSALRIAAMSIVGCAVVARPSVGQDDDYVRVMTYNIRLDTPVDGENAWPNRKERVAGLLAYHEADVFGLQEALRHQIRYLEKAMDGFAWYGVGRDDGASGGEFSPIYYRVSRFELLESGTFWLSENPDSVGSVGWDAALPRIASWVLLRDRRTDSPTLYVNTHFDHVGQKARLESARLLRRRVGRLGRGAPVVVMGDFNATPDSPPYEALTSDDPSNGLVLLDLAGLSESGHYGPAETWSSFAVGAPDVRRIDYVFGSAGTQVRRSAVLTDQLHGRYPSDHLPVLVEMSVSRDVRPGR